VLAAAAGAAAGRRWEGIFQVHPEVCPVAKARALQQLQALALRLGACGCQVVFSGLTARASNSTVGARLLCSGGEKQKEKM
jgi:hypothetical protein